MEAVWPEESDLNGQIGVEKLETDAAWMRVTLVQVFSRVKGYGLSRDRGICWVNGSVPVVF